MKQLIWSLVIEPQWTQSAVWTIEDGTTKVLSIGPSVRWENAEELLDAADATLSSAATSLPPDSPEPSKTVFGVSPSWVSEGQIKREHLDKIREICGKLSLEPTGFVVLPEAVAHYIKTEEGSPLNGVIIGVGTDALDIAVFKLGNLMGTVQVGRSVSPVDDVVEGLARFASNETLPSRFLVYNGQTGELEEFRQALIAGDWLGEIKDKLSFLHTPAVEIIELETKMLAVSLAGASEMASVSKVSLVAQDVLPVLDEEEAPVKEDLSAHLESSDVTPEELGFESGEDSFEDSKVSEEDNNLSPMPTGHTGTSVAAGSPLLGLGSFKFMNKFKSLVGGVKFPSKKPKHSAPPEHVVREDMVIKTSSFGKKRIMHNIFSNRRPTGTFLIVLCLLLAGVSAAWWFLPRAEVLIYIAPKHLEKKENIIFDFKGSSLDSSQKIVPAHLQEVSVSGDKTGAATGQKIVGDKAQGKVSIRNGTAVSIKLSAGTILVGENDLKFSISQAASVSAAESPSTPGSTTVDVTAESIGSQYNLATGASFKVGNYPKSDVDAIVQTDLTGGSSRDITAVSADDLKNLENDLLSELTEQGKSRIKTEVLDDEIFIEGAVTQNVSQKTFSNKVGDEASTIKLSMEAKISGAVVKRQDLSELANQILRDQIPNGFVMRPDQLTTDFSVSDKPVNDKWSANANFIVNLLPEIDPVDISKKISGKYPQVAQEYLQTIPGFVRARIKLSPSLPDRFATLPQVAKHISVEIAAER